MDEKKTRTEDLMQRNQQDQLGDDELEKVNGGGFYMAVDAGKCPKQLSKYVIYLTDTFKWLANSPCYGCPHIKEIDAAHAHCEFAVSGRYEWE